VHFGLTFGGSDNKTDLIGWSNVDWAQDVDSRPLIGAFVFNLAGGYVLWSSKKQPTVTLSTAEAEYMAAKVVTLSHMLLGSPQGVLIESREPPRSLPGVPKESPGSLQGVHMDQS
jgi:hypothetical protein